MYTLLSSRLGEYGALPHMDSGESEFRHSERLTRQECVAGEAMEAGQTSRTWNASCKPTDVCKGLNTGSGNAAIMSVESVSRHLPLTSS